MSFNFSSRYECLYTIHTSRSKRMYFDIFHIQVIKLLSTLSLSPPLVVVTIQRHKTDVCDILHDDLRKHFAAYRRDDWYPLIRRMLTLVWKLISNQFRCDSRPWTITSRPTVPIYYSSKWNQTYPIQFFFSWIKIQKNYLI